MVCNDCGGIFCKEWCPKKKRAIIVDRDWNGYIPRRRIPFESFRRDVERAPATSEGTSRKYPREFRDIGREYPPRKEGEKYYEYPSNHDRHDTPFDYPNQTNNKETTPNQGYGRAITKADKTLLGVSRHPPGDLKKLDRFDEVIDSRVPGLEKEVWYPKGSDGKPETKKYGRKKK